MDLSKISSIDIIKDIFNYIKDENFKYKLFIHSKYFQKKLDINLIELKKKYLSKIKFYIDDYLHASKDNSSLTNLYENFLRHNKLNREFLESMIYDIYQNKTIEEDLDEKDADGVKDFYCQQYYYKFINIYSPLFGLLSKTKNFEKIFTIEMKPIKNIKDNSIKKAFDNLIKSNKSLSIEYSLDNIRDFDLKELNIKIKRLTLIITASNPLEKDINYLFETLFSIKNIENNLIYLEINGADGQANSIIFNKLNDFKLLKYLYIRNLNINCNIDLYLNELSVLIIKNSNIFNRLISQKLKVLKFYNCLTFKHELDKANFKDLKTLYINNCSLSNLDVLENVNFDKLEQLDLCRNKKISNINILEKLNLKELKELNLSENKI